MEHFDFLPQSASVDGLLKACLSALPYVPEPEKNALAQAMREFETFGSPALWSAADVDTAGDYSLTEEEKREAIGRFIQNYECKESDWMAIDGHARDVQSERCIHVRVEYDPLYTGGDYQGVGKVVFIPLSLIEELAKQDPDSDDGVELAFTKITGMDCMHIVSYTLDEHYNQNGERVES